MPNAPYTSEIPPPSRPSFQLASLFRLRKAGRRWPFAMRAALSMGIPVVIGWLAGDVAAGLMGTTGAFTALYGNDRPYLNRAFHLAIIALSLAVTVAFGVWAATIPWLVVPAITLIATSATFLCNALKVGPPGAYIFMLACAAGTAMGAAHLAPWHVATLVLAGGALAWILHMMGAITAPRGPERQALLLAGNAVGDFIDAVGTPRQDKLRHEAALALHQAWTTLVNHQPAQPQPSGTLTRLRSESRELHMIFADAINATTGDKQGLPALAERARHISERSRTLGASDITDPKHVPLGRVSGWRMMAEGSRPESQPFQISLRVCIAAAASGLLGIAIGLDHAYWATATAVLVLHQGLDWAGTLQRGLQRFGGTLAGLLLAGAVLSVHPAGLWLAVAVMVLQFIIEMLVLRNYALAVVFITAVALVIASGGHPVENIPHLLWVRGEDTAIGCAVGFVVFALGMRPGAGNSITHELVRTIAAIDMAARLLTKGEAITPSARSARRDLQHHTILLLQAYDMRAGSTASSRAGVEHFWPSVIATQRLAYRILATGWQIEEAEATGGDKELARKLFGADGYAALHASLANIISAIQNGKSPLALPDLPAFLQAEVRLLSQSIVFRGA